MKSDTNNRYNESDINIEKREESGDTMARKKVTYVRGHYKKVGKKKVHVKAHYRNVPNPAKKKARKKRR